MLTLNDYLKDGQTILPNLLLNNYAKLSLSDGEFLVLIQLFHFQQQGIFFPAPEEIAQRTGKELAVIYQLLTSLQEKKMMTLETKTDEKNIKYDQYDLSPLWLRLSELLEKNEEKVASLMKQKKVQELFEVFQQEYGKPLSSMQLEMLGQWLEVDHYHPDVIRLALKEAVLNQAYSMRYIDSILLSWSREKLDTKDKVLAAQRKRKTAFVSQEVPEDLPEIPWVDWLKGDEK